MRLSKAPKRPRKVTEEHRARAFRVGVMEGSVKDLRVSGLYGIEDPGPVIRAQRTPDGKGVTIEAYQERVSRGGHSYFRERPCPMCGDLDGCHLWRERPKEDRRGRP